jgi:ribosomal protein L20
LQEFLNITLFRGSKARKIQKQFLMKSLSSTFRDRKKTKFKQLLLTRLDTMGSKASKLGNLKRYSKFGFCNLNCS